MYSLDSYFRALTSFKIEEVTKSLMPSEAIPNIVPIVTVREGSCLYNAISVILTGNCQLKYEL